ncbi:MAG TPA: SHOCT domain-containing protein, partial [Phycisphaerae bacterium]|nr:SHOCT domain-containing protein [Phycisphaerae bacterium]
MSIGVETAVGGTGSSLPAELPLAVGGALYWTIAVVGAIAALVLAGAIVRARRLAVGKGGEPVPGLTIEQLEALRRQGTISDEEYRRAR